MEYKHLMASSAYQKMWAEFLGNEIGQLAYGIPWCVEGTKTMFFIKKEEVLQDRFRDVKHGKFVVEYWENKEEKERLRLRVGGDRINYLD